MSAFLILKNCFYLGRSNHLLSGMAAKRSQTGRSFFGLKSRAGLASGVSGWTSRGCGQVSCTF